MSIIGLFPSTPLHYSLHFNSLQWKLHIPPKFKLEPTTPQFLSLKDLLHSENHLSTPQIPNKFLCSNPQPSESEVVKCLFFLNQIIQSDDSVYNSSSVCKQIHGCLVKVGALKFDGFLGNKLVVAYSKNLELLNDACKLFDEIPDKRISAYAALINAFCRVEKWVELLSMFKMMLNHGFLPDNYLIPTILKACSVIRVAKIGKMVHGYAQRKGFYEDVFVGNALIDMYSNCGVLRLAKSVFDTMKMKDVVSWTAIIVAYLSEGLLVEAMQTFDRLELDGVKADLITWNAIISGFALNGEIELAVKTLKEMQKIGVRPQVNSWNGFISGCIQNERYEDALSAFVEMFWSSLSPNVVTTVSTLAACANMKDLNLGKTIHGYAIKLGFHDFAHLSGSLINMYWKCTRLNDAEKIFTRIKNKTTFTYNEMVAAYISEEHAGRAFGLLESMKEYGPKPDQITYNTVLGAYLNAGRTKEVDNLLYEMTEMGFLPNGVTFNILISGFQQSGLSHESLRYFQAMQAPQSDTFLSSILKNPVPPNPVNVTSALAACSDLCSLNHGKELHGYIIRNRLESNIYVASALIDMYAKCTDMDSAKEIFSRTENKNIVTWNTMIGTYINRRQEYEAFNLFDRMLKEAIEPSHITYMMLIPACGDIGAFRLGREMFGYLMKNGFDESNSYLAYPFIEFGGSSGSIGKDSQEFDPKLEFQSKFRSNIAIKYIYHTSFVPINGVPLELC